MRKFELPYAQKIKMKKTAGSSWKRNINGAQQKARNNGRRKTVPNNFLR